MDIVGKRVLVLGGAGLVGIAVCRELMQYRPRCLIVAARRKARAEEACDTLRREQSQTSTKFMPAWGDVFLRADWQRSQEITRSAILSDAARRRCLIADILDPLNAEIVESSLLSHLILGLSPEIGEQSVDIVVDCINTATAVSYQDIYGSASGLINRLQLQGQVNDEIEATENLVASLYVPQIVRHIQILYEAMRRAKTTAYVKVGTSGTGGLGFNIPYTHGEERPSRLLLSKAAIAGAQSLLTFLMARTPQGPRIVKEIKPSALIGWNEIRYGTIQRAGQTLPRLDCRPEEAVSARDPKNLVAKGQFGVEVGQELSGVYIDTGENGLFSAAEFSAITNIGQMQLVTPEEIARNVVLEIVGGATGHDVVAALDGSVMEPSFRGGHLRRAALNRLAQLEDRHGEAVAFEILGPPRLSKLLFEAYLIKRVCQTHDIIAEHPANLGERIEQEIVRNLDLRQRIISIGIGILLSDGERLLRGPVLKSSDADHGWVDCTADNLQRWQERMRAILSEVQTDFSGESSSRCDRQTTTSYEFCSDISLISIGDIAAWVLIHEEHGQRSKG